MNKKELTTEILKYSVNNIQESCLNCGHPTSWKYFETELKTYNKDDMIYLLDDLKENFYIKKPERRTKRIMEKEKLSREIDNFCCSMVEYGGLDIQFALNYLEAVDKYPSDLLADEVKEFSESTETPLNDIDVGYVAVSYVFQNVRNKINEVLNLDIENDLSFYVYGNYCASGIDRKDEDLEELQTKFNEATEEQKKELKEDKCFIAFAEDIELKI